MAVERYVQCRLTGETHARLTAFLNALRARAARHPAKHRPALSTGKVGLSDAIDELLWLFDKEHERKSSYNRARSAAKRAAAREQEERSVADMLFEGCPNTNGVSPGVGDTPPDNRPV